MALPNPNEVNTLIRRAFIYAERVASEGEELTSQMIQEGIQILNEIIRSNNITGEPWNLLTREDVNLVKGSETITLDGWSKILKYRYLLGSVFIPIPMADLNGYLNISSVQSSTGIPLVSYLQRTETGFILNVYLKPDQNYTLEIWGYKSVNQIVNSTDEFVGLESFYQDYFLYELAYQVQQFYHLPTTRYVLYKRAQLINKLNTIREVRTDVRISACSQTNSSSTGALISILSQVGPTSVSAGWRGYA